MKELITFSAGSSFFSTTIHSDADKSGSRWANPSRDGLEKDESLAAAQLKESAEAADAFKKEILYKHFHI